MTLPQPPCGLCEAACIAEAGARAPQRRTSFLRLKQVVARVGLSPMTLWRREHDSPPTFPRRVRLGRNAVGWPENEIEAWCAARLAERDHRPESPIPGLVVPQKR